MGRGVFGVTLAVALGLGFGAAAPGCFWVTTKHEGDKLRRDVATLDDRMTAQEDGLAAKITQIEDVLAQATKLLQRNSADLGAEVQDLAEENANLTGLVMEAKRAVGELRSHVEEVSATYEERILALEARLAALEKSPAAPERTAEEVFAEGKRALQAGKHAAARQELAQVARKWPGHELADDATYYRAESHFQQAEYEKAIALFQRVFDTYAKSEWADDALLRAGQAAEKLKWCTDARAYYGVLRKKYPDSPLAGKAAERDAALKKNARNKKFCQS
jgi:TolA-binding protein